MSRIRHVTEDTHTRHYAQIQSELSRNTPNQLLPKLVHTRAFDHLRGVQISHISTSHYKLLWAGQHSRYSGWLRAGRSGDRIPVGSEIFRTCPDRPWGPPSLLYNRYRVFHRGKKRPGRDADPSPLSSAVGHERVELYLYSPYGPYGLYRASVHVQGCTLLQTSRRRKSGINLLAPEFYI